MLKAADAFNSAKRNLIRLAELCMAMDTITDKNTWAALYNFTVSYAVQDLRAR